MSAHPEASEIESERLLGVLGDRVRTLRAHRGMTRKVLARDSGVSERYLAQLEQGHGNISVVLLARVGRPYARNRVSCCKCVSGEPPRKY